MEAEQCVWNIYDDDTKGILGIGLYITGLTSLILSCWLMAAFMKTSLTCEKSYLSLMNLTAGCIARLLFAGFLFSGISAVAHRWVFGQATCKFYGFLGQFVGVYQMESLNHMAIERYVVAKYYKNGWEVARSNYVMYVGFCWFFSILYSFPPIFGVSGYSWDYSCTACTLDLILPSDTYLKLGMVVLLLLVGIKPLIMMFTMLRWTRQLEKQCYKENEQQHQILLTKSTTSIVMTAMGSWSLGALCAGWTVASQLFYGYLIQPPILLAMLSSFCSEAVPGVIVVTAFCTNEHVRNAMMSLLGEPTHNKDA